MHKAIRFKLHFGPYRTPKFRYGRLVTDLERGKVRVVGLTDARIPWPIAKNNQRQFSPVLYGDLARAVRRESVQAVAHWWGVSRWRVKTWRRELGVEEFNEGTLLAHTARGHSPANKRNLRLAVKKARDPIRLAQARGGPAR